MDSKNLVDTSQFRAGDILLYKGTDFTSHVIQLFTKSQYSHVAVVVSPDIALVIESNTGHQSGVRACDLRKLDFSTIDVYRIKFGYLFNSQGMTSFLVNCLGARYDFLGVIWLGLLKILSLFTFLLWRPFNSFQKSKDYFCSELCYMAFKVGGGLDIVPQVPEADVTSPGDIANSSILEKVEL